MDLVAVMPRVRAPLRAAIGLVVADGLPVILSGGVGLAWGQSSSRWVLLTPWSVLCWAHARTRLTAFWLGTAYHAVAARSLMVGMSTFFDVPVALGMLTVVGCAGVHGLVWSMCWSQPDCSLPSFERALRVMLLLGSACLPILGAVSIASPLSAAGLLFPGLGWLGLGLLVGLLMVAARSERAALVVGVVCALRCALWDLWPVTAPVAPAWEAVHTSLRVSRDIFDFEHQWDVAQTVMRGVRQTSLPWSVAPESVGGLWQPSMRRVWSRLDRELRTEGRVAIVGATLPRADGDFDNAAVVLGADAAPYRQRMPIPLAMWRPWSEDQGDGVFHARWFGSGVVHARGHVVGVLICFEAALVWPMLGSVAQGAEVLVALTNGQWLAGTGAVNAQRQTLESWGALFGLPVVLATNE